MSLHQLYWLRPIKGYSNYSTPIKGLYLCGSGTHPGIKNSYLTREQLLVTTVYSDKTKHNLYGETQIPTFWWVVPEIVRTDIHTLHV